MHYDATGMNIRNADSGAMVSLSGCQKPNGNFQDSRLDGFLEIDMAWIYRNKQKFEVQKIGSEHLEMQ